MTKLMNELRQIHKNIFGKFPRKDMSEESLLKKLEKKKKELSKTDRDLPSSEEIANTYTFFLRHNGNAGTVTRTINMQDFKENYPKVIESLMKALDSYVPVEEAEVKKI